MSHCVVKTKRKVSCLPCRLKKVKCDGEKPCFRCYKKDSIEHCVYARQQPLGRPPKNAVVNKLVLSRTKQHSLGLCKDFIIENIAYTIPAGNKFLHHDKTKNIHFFLDSHFTDVFATAVPQLAIVRIATTYDFIPDIKMYDLLEMHTWTAAEVANIFLSSFSSIPLDAASDYNSVASAVFQKLALHFFGEPPLEPPLINPLTTLPTQQAVGLIECFFCVHPNSLILNKTLLLQGFWTDSVDPLLLCAIYGTTTYFAKMLEGKPVGLWEAVDHDHRNAFLDYAYFLLSKSSTEATVVKYQAVVLLGMFETVYGFPKRGMSMLGLAYMIGSKLGVTDGSIFSTEISDVEAELLTYAHWTNYINIVRGSVDVGHVAHFIGNVVRAPPLPPVSVEKSLSYELEKASGNQRLFRSYYYVVESFYVGCVVARYTNRLLLCFPEVKHNLLYPRHGKTRPQVGYPKVEELVPRLTAALQEFELFIQEHRHTWSKWQSFTIETTRKLFDVHLIFIKDHGPVTEGSNYANTAFDIFRPTKLSISDAKTKERVQLAIRKIYNMVDDLQVFLSDTRNYKNQSTLLPRAIIVSVLETAVTVICLKHRQDLWDTVALDYLNQISDIAQSHMWTNWTTIKAVQKRVDRYLRQYGNSAAADGPLYDGLSFNDLLDAPILSNAETTASDMSCTMENSLALASFFDPCSSWLTPMTSVLPLDMMLWDNTSDISAKNSSTIDNGILDNLISSATLLSTPSSLSVSAPPSSSTSRSLLGTTPDIVVDSMASQPQTTADVNSKDYFPRNKGSSLSSHQDVQSSIQFSSSVSSSPALSSVSPASLSVLMDDMTSSPSTVSTSPYSLQTRPQHSLQSSPCHAPNIREVLFTGHPFM